MNELLNIEFICGLLEITFRAGKEQDRQSAEDQLKKLSFHSEEFFDILIKILHTQNINSNIKESCVLYLEKINKKKLIDNNYTNERRSYEIKTYLELLTIENVSFKVKNIIKDILTKLLYQNFNSISQFLIPVIINNISSIKINECLAGLLIIQSIFEMPECHFDIKYFVLQIIEPLNSLISKFLLMFNEKLAQNQEINEIQRIFNIMNYWCIVIELIFKKLIEIKDFSIESLITNINLLQIFEDILNFTIKKGQQLNFCIFSTTGELLIDDSLNSIKSLVLKILKNVIFFFMKCGYFNIFKNFHFQKFLNNQLWFIINSFKIYFEYENNTIKKQLFQINLEKIYIEAINLLEKMAKLLDFYQIFSDNKKIILIIIFNFIKTDYIEYQIFLDSPSEFCNLSIDTCEKQISDTLKTITAKLLESMSDNIDGFTTLIARICFEFILSSIKTESHDITTLLMFLGDELNFFSSYKEEMRCESSFMILTILSYIIPKRKDLLYEIEAILINYIDLFILNQNKLILARLSLFLGYYLDDLFIQVDYHQYFSRYIMFLVNLISLNKDNLAISYQAIDALENSLTSSDNFERGSNIILDVLILILKNLESTDNEQIYDLIQELLKIFSDVINDDETIFKKCILHIKNKIQSEIDKNEGIIVSSNLKINKCWNIIRSVGENKNYVPKFIESIEDCIFPFYQMMKNIDTIDFDEDIYLLIGELIKASKFVTKKQLIVFEYIHNYFMKYNCNFGNMYCALNYYVFYGKEIIAENSNYIDSILLLAKLSMLNFKSNECNQAQGCLLIHLVIQNYLKSLNQSQIDFILQATFERLNSIIINNFLKSKINGIFLNLFIYNYKFIENFLIENSKLEYVMALIFEKLDMYLEEYNKKVFIFGISSIFMQESVNSNIFSIFPKFLAGLIQILNIKTYNKTENLNVKRHFKEEIEEFDHATSEEDSIEDEDEVEEENPIVEDEKFEITTVMKNFISFLLEEDEYQCFRNLINHLKEKKNELFTALINNLCPEEQRIIQEILLYQKITIIGKAIKIKTRKIVKVRKNN